MGLGLQQLAASLYKLWATTDCLKRAGATRMWDWDGAFGGNSLSQLIEINLHIWSLHSPYCSVHPVYLF
jgi:hypothetical protein